MPKILIAEDDPQVAELMRLYFERSAPAIELMVVDGGQACLNALAMDEYDLLLLDLRMPDIDGLAVLGYLSLEDDPTPVVVVTSHGDAERTVSAIRAGAVDCVNKKSPQFLDVVAIAQRVMKEFPRELRMTRAAEKAQLTVLVADADASAIGALIELAQERAPWLRIIGESTFPAFERRLVFDDRPDALIVGELKGLDDPTDALRLCRSLALGVPLIAVMHSPRPETAVAAFHLGAYDCVLKKPGYMEELFRSLTQVLRQKNRVRVFEGTFG